MISKVFILLVCSFISTHSLAKSIQIIDVPISIRKVKKSVQISLKTQAAIYYLKDKNCEKIVTTAIKTKSSVEFVVNPMELDIISCRKL